jgi:threonine synthase
MLPTANSTGITLGEGNTPLVRSRTVGPGHGIPDLWFKLENCNPSGSYKDRFASAEVARILAAGVRRCVATSSGNTGASLASYAARAGISCSIVVNQLTPSGKLTQMRAHGARIVRVRDFAIFPGITRDVFEALVLLARSEGIPLVVSAYRYCPEGMSGVESIGPELVRQFGAPPAHVFVPVGSGGFFIATCRGLAGTSARVHAVQPEGCSTVVAAFERGNREIVPVTSTTRVSGLSVPFDIDGSVALDELVRNGGLGIAVPDSEVFAAQRLLLHREGIYCEPAGAAALAGLLRAVRDGRLVPGGRVVCIVSGHGFKDPDSIAAAAGDTADDVVEPDALVPYLRQSI